jgi:hypothetical protein
MKTGRPSGKWRNETNVCQICANDCRNWSGLANQFCSKVWLETAKRAFEHPSQVVLCCGWIDMMYKHTRLVCFCLNISSKNRNPMDLGISDSTMMSAMVLESILSDSEKSVLSMLQKWPCAVTLFNPVNIYHVLYFCML